MTGWSTIHVTQIKTAREQVRGDQAHGFQGHVNAREVWATEEFKRELEKKPTLYEAVEISGGVNIKKPNSTEADTFITTYRLAPKSR